MQRRRFLHGIASAAGLTAVSPFLRESYAAQSTGNTGGIDKVVVIGGGIVGAAIAYNLAKRGCQVVVVEKSAPASQASGNSFAWINASYFDTPQSYFTLRTHSLNEYHRLAQDVNIPIRWGGSLEWYDSVEQEKEVAEGVRRIQVFGAPTWMIDRERASEIEPKLRLDGDPRIAWCSRDGAIDPAGTTRALLARVEEYGGDVVYPANVTGIERQRGNLRVITNVDTFDADHVVAATGVGTSDIARVLGLKADPMRPATPGIIVTTAPMQNLLNAISYTSDTHFHQLTDGRVILGEKAGAPQTDEHRALLSGRPNSYPTEELAAEHADRVIATAARYVPELGNTNAERVGVGWRPLPADGLPVVGELVSMPGVYLAAMHSGVTLAPIVGHLVAMEILDGVRTELLTDFRYERFL